MEAIKLNEAQILTEAWKKYLSNYSKGLSFKSAYKIAEVEAKNEAILAARKVAYAAKLAKENEEYNANYITGPSRYYGVNTYNGD
jgi:hypothetical protein